MNEKNIQVIIDTMIFLHFKPLEQIDLCQLLSAKSVTIILPRITLRELDKHKSNHSSSRIRERAKKALSTIDKCLRDNICLRENTWFRFASNNPNISYAEYGLAETWQDDVLIANAIVMNNEQQSTALITDDTGVRLKCAQLGIATYTLPEELKLESDLDEMEKEIKQLQKELAQVRSTLPKIRVTFEKTNSDYERFTVFESITEDQDKIEQLVRDKSAKYTELTKQSIADSQSANALLKYTTHGGLFDVSDAEIARYNEDRKKYITRYREYLLESYNLFNEERRTVSFVICLTNEGTSPAEDVDISVHFPDGFTLSDEEPSFSIAEPNPPRSPMTQMEMITSNLNRQLDFSSRLYDFPKTELFKTFKIERGNSYTITEHYMRIKQETKVQLPCLYITFDTDDAVSSFNCSYTINAANIPNPISGKLNFVIDTNMQDDV